MSGDLSAAGSPPRLEGKSSTANLVLLALGRLVSDLGSSIFGFAVSLYVLDRTGSPRAFAFVLVAATVPKIFINLFAAFLVDRLDRKRIIVACDFASGIAVFGFYLLFQRWSDSISLLVLYGATLSIINALFDLAVVAAIPEIAPRELVPKANSLIQGVGALVTIIGPILGALLYAAIGLGPIFLVDGTSFAVAGAFSLLIRFASPPRGAREGGSGYTAEFGRVYAYLREQRVILHLLLFATAVQVVFMPLVLIVLPYVTYNVLKVSGFQLSLIEAAWAVGAIVASLLVSFRSETDSILRRFFVLIELQAILFLGWLLVKGPIFDGPGKWPATILFVLLLAAMGFLNGLQGVLIYSHFQLRIPEEIAGRFFGVVSTAFLVSVPIGLGFYGAILGPGNWPVVVAVSSLLLVVGTLLVARRPLLREYFSGIGAPGATAPLDLSSNSGLPSPLPSETTPRPEPVAIPPSGEPPAMTTEPPIPMRRILALAAVALVATGCALLLAFRQIAPLRPAPASAPPESFAAGRAIEELRVIARTYHPMGSEEHASVAAHLERALADLGYETNVQRTVGVDSPAPRVFVTGRVVNVAGRRRGREPGGAVVLVAHYDSEPTSPGASDNGVAVAALLETARALRAAGETRNDVVFLFTDGEESGLLGARAFVAEHPWAREIRLVLNFDARGTTGPSLLFESSPGNLDLLRTFRDAAPLPLSFSFAGAVQPLLPNETDFEAFAPLGAAGLNFAFIGGADAYSTSSDSIDRVDLATLQHHGAIALSLARAFANADLDRLRTPRPDAVAFPLVRGLLVVHSARLALPFAGAAFLLFAGWSWSRRRTPRFARGVAVGFLGFLIAVVASAAIGYGLSTAVDGLHGDGPDSSWNDLYLVAFVAAALALVALLSGWLARRGGEAAVTIGLLLPSLILAIVSSVFAPGASYLFVWPLVGALLGAIGKGFFDGRGRPAIGSALALVLTIAPAVLLFSVAIDLTAQALTLERGELLLLVVAWAFTPAVATVVFELGRLGRRLWIPLALVAAVAGFGEAIRLELSGMARLRSDSILYAVDADRREAIFATPDPALDPWTRQFFAARPSFAPISRFLPGSGERPFLSGPAPLIPLLPPEVVLLRDSVDGDLRTLALRISSPRGARNLTVEAPGPTGIVAATIDGRPLEIPKRGADESAPGPWIFTENAPSASGTELVLTVRGRETIELRVGDLTDGFPRFPGRTYEPRPAGFTPRPIGLRDGVAVTRQLRFQLDGSGSAPEPSKSNPR
jgi:MFS family permease